MMKLFVALALAAAMPSAQAMGKYKTCDDSTQCVRTIEPPFEPTDACQSVREEAINGAIVSATTIALGLLPVETAMRALAATAVGTIAAGAYGQAVLGGVMGDFLGATICVLELAVYLSLAADASRFDASAFLRLAVVVSLPQIYGLLRDRGEKKAC